MNAARTALEEVDMNKRGKSYGRWSAVMAFHLSNRYLSFVCENEQGRPVGLISLVSDYMCLKLTGEGALSWNCPNHVRGIMLRYISLNAYQQYSHMLKPSPPLLSTLGFSIID